MQSQGFALLLQVRHEQGWSPASSSGTDIRFSQWQLGAQEHPPQRALRAQGADAVPGAAQPRPITSHHQEQPGQTDKIHSHSLMHSLHFSMSEENRDGKWAK